jgi:hypothetical protein
MLLVGASAVLLELQAIDADSACMHSPMTPDDATARADGGHIAASCFAPAVPAAVALAAAVESVLPHTLSATAPAPLAGPAS